jgi:hypothetical protein
LGFKTGFRLIKRKRSVAVVVVENALRTGRFDWPKKMGRREPARVSLENSSSRNNQLMRPAISWSVAQTAT